MQTFEQIGSSYHLLFEDLRSNSESKELNSRSSAARGFICIEIPARGGVVAVNRNGGPQIVDTLCCGSENIFIFQPLQDATDYHLLMVCPGLSRPLINSIPSPPIALLSVKDELIFPAAVESFAYVSIYHRPRLGPPPEHRIGRKCPICRSKLFKNTITYTCYQCGQVIHYQSRSKPDSGALDCANICRHCPVCTARVNLTAGYVYLPEPLPKRG